VLKDAQIMPDGRLKLQEDSDFCGRPDPKDLRPLGKGICPGSAPNYQGGTWALTVNGQVDPVIDVREGTGEAWRILNASANATHWLALQDVESGADLPVQVFSVDGVSLEIPAGSTLPDLQAKLGRKMKVVACPKIVSATHRGSGKQPLCAERIVMMPSSRIEIGVSARTGTSRRALLRTYAWTTGPAGNDWPAVELASIRFPEVKASASGEYFQVRGQSSSLLEPGGMLSKTLPRTGGANPTPARCQPMRPGWVRQIVFGQPTAHSHGLGYREVQADQPLVAPTDFQLALFDHAADPTVCVSLAPGDRPVSETWELVNIAGEDHNFHIHQARFELVRTETLADGSLTPERLGGARVFHDNIPVPRGGSGCDGTVGAWQRGSCAPSRVVVRIPFTIVGDFVYHCHILGHEDAGMMAKISVVPARRAVPTR
jgi:hypothetical protein